MPESFCDQVVMSATKEMLESRDEAFSDIVIHLQNCPACREAVSRKLAIRRLAGFVDMDPIAARRMAVRVLSARKEAPRGFSWAWIGAYALSATFAALLGVSIYWRPVNEQPVARPQAAKALPAPAVVEKPSPIEHRAIEKSKTLVMQQGAKIWLRPGTSMALLSDTLSGVHAKVDRGQIIINIEKRTPGFKFVVETPTATVTSLGTIFSVEVAENSREIIRVSKSAVVVRPSGEREPIVVRAGEELVLGGADTQTAEKEVIARDLCLVQGACTYETPQREAVSADRDKPVAPKPSKRREAKANRISVAEKIDTALWEGRLEDAEHLLVDWKDAWGDGRFKRMIKLASAYRSARKFERAVTVYERLYGLYPDRDAAINGLVSMAQIKQAFLKDSLGAAHYFDRYMQKRPQGILAEAAAAGKVRALYNMRHWQEVVEASKQYMQLHTGGPSEREILQKRRLALDKLGKLIE